MSTLVNTSREDSNIIATAWKINPIQWKFVSPTDVMATPTQITVTIYNSRHEVFSSPAKKENMSTATGVKAFNIYTTALSSSPIYTVK